MSEHSKLNIEPLNSGHNRAAFSCGVEAVDVYIRRQAGQDQRKRVAAAFVLAEGNEILGFYTLSATSLLLRELPESVARKLPKYPLIPATLLGRLAVRTAMRGRGIGALLLFDALRRSLDHSEQIASSAVVVDAKDEVARRWYESYGFLCSPDNPRRMLLPMATIAKLF